MPREGGAIVRVLPGYLDAYGHGGCVAGGCWRRPEGLSRREPLALLQDRLEALGSRCPRWGGDWVRLRPFRPMMTSVACPTDEPGVNFLRFLG